MKTVKNFLVNWGKVIGLGLTLTGLLLICRHLGAFQIFELAAYDLLFQWRALEPIDERIIIVGLSESDVKKYYPLSDSTLAKLLGQIADQQPSVIGLDFYRDVSVAIGTEELTKIFETTPNLIGIEKVIGDENSKISSPSSLKERGQVAASDLVIDSDGILRRGLLTPIADGQTSLFSLGATMALLYLQENGITPSTTEDGNCMKLAEETFCPLPSNAGGYHQADAGGFPFLLNYRSPEQSFEIVSFSEVIEGNISADIFHNRLVFIGSVAPSVKDVFYTPFSRSFTSAPKAIYGVEIQANIASHILSAVIDGRKTITVLPTVLESVWIIIWGTISTILIWHQRKTKSYLTLLGKIIGISLLLALSLVTSSYFAFLLGWWLPTFLALLEIIMISLATSSLILHQKNQEIQKLFKELSAAQEQIILDEKQAALANLVAGVAHEINNPLNFILNFADISLEWVQKLKNVIKGITSSIARETGEEIERILNLIEENLQEILTHGNKADRITQNLLRQGRSETSDIVLTDINELVDSTFHIVTYSKQVAAGDLYLYLESDYDPTIGERSIAAAALNQVLVNLIDNACDAVLEKKMKVNEEFEPSVSVNTQLLNGSEVEISIIDNGEGIQDDITEHIYEPFKTTKPPGEGTGLGLYFTYELAKKHRWKIRWIRDAGQTKFFITLAFEEENKK